MNKIIISGKVKIIYEKRTEGDLWNRKEYITENKTDYDRVMNVFKDMKDNYRLIKEEVIEEEQHNKSISLVGCLPVYPYKRE